MNYFTLLLFAIGMFSFNGGATESLNDDEIYVLDTITAENDGTIVLKYRKFKGDVSSGISYRDIDEADFTEHTEIISNHPTLNNNNSVSAIKSSTPAGSGLLITNENGETMFLFQNPLSEVIFIGFKE